MPVVHLAQRRRDAERAVARFGGVVERHVDDRLAERMSGCAYYELPDVVNVATSTRYLFTMRLPRRLDDLSYPETLQYHRRGVVMTTSSFRQRRCIAPIRYGVATPPHGGVHLPSGQRGVDTETVA